ncbi:MAG: MotA/TolQ/ExbB proton channel family protein [Polyangiaceae bacterium]|nr:MotA/TolQ/ExbB proton channel family protein [Polyangiaceae bacterium]MCW5791698.1 MotA/TolQ/ExbB proton channel family protein [Polyangiaceae bacterium]
MTTNLVHWLERLMTNFGAGWVMWLLIFLSVVSVAIMLERGYFYWRLRDDIGGLAQELRALLRKNDIEGAIKRMQASPSAEAAVVVAGLMEVDRGAKSAEEAMNGAAALQRMKLEKWLAYLGTLGNNAPFIGLFGTVIGIVQAFKALGMSEGGAAAAAGAPQEVMAAIAEALVATAIGLLVAIPAVAMFNLFMRMSKAILANTEALSRVLLSHLVAVDSGSNDSSDASED